MDSTTGDDDEHGNEKEEEEVEVVMLGMQLGVVSRLPQAVLVLVLALVLDDELVVSKHCCCLVACDACSVSGSSDGVGSGTITAPILLLDLVVVADVVAMGRGRTPRFCDDVVVIS